MWQEFLSDPFGLRMEFLDTPHMLMRAPVVFFIGLALMRISGFRILGRSGD
ncbi:MAG: hypothetical protein U0T73_04945 [Chitinophagales bacterium]